MSTQTRQGIRQASRWVWPLILATLVVAGITLAVLSRTRPEPLRVGGLFDLSGAAATRGVDEHRGAALAFQEWFATQRDGSVDFVIRDAPANDPSAVIRAFQALLEDGATVVIGPTGETATEAMVTATGKAQVVVLAPVASPGIDRSHGHGFFFSICDTSTDESGAPPSSRLAAFLDHFEQEYGEEPQTSGAACAYDATRLLLRIIDEGHREPDKIRQALLAVKDFESAFGDTLAFDETGQNRGSDTIDR